MFNGLDGGWHSKEVALYSPILCETWGKASSVIPGIAVTAERAIDQGAICQ